MSERVKWLKEACPVCGARLNSWDARCSKALSYKTPVCERCIAKEYDQTPAQLRESLEEFFGLRPCLGL